MSLLGFSRVIAATLLLSACSSRPAQDGAEGTTARAAERSSASAALTRDASGRVTLAARTTGLLARIALPARASGLAELEDHASGLRVAFSATYAGASAAEGEGAPARIENDTVTYAAAGPSGADVLFRPSAVGAEDFVTFAQKPATEEARYRVDVSAVAGLRLVENVLEYLDPSGTPRLRMAAPYVQDRRGTVHAARVSVDDCAVDRNPAGPWGRPVTPPGNTLCTVRVAWDDASRPVEYPAVLDPAWTATKGLMTLKRSDHTATLLADGTVLVAGGRSPNVARNLSAELYDPKTGTFAATGAMTVERTEHAAVRLKSGDVLIVSGTVNNQACDLYEVATAKFRAVGSLTGPRSGMQATLLSDGKVLAAGGLNSSGAILDTAERYDPATERWTATGRMVSKRAEYALGTLSGGSVVAIGGLSSALGPTSSAELFNSTAGTWTPTGSLSEARNAFAGAVLADGRMLVAGGVDSSGKALLATSEIYDPKTAKFTKSGSLATARYGATLTALANGGAVAVGGNSKAGTTVPLKSAEVYDPEANEWTALPDLSAPRAAHTATLLDDGRVLVTGGVSTGDTLATAEILALDANGVACTTPATCASGFCADGVCCAEVCDGACDACSKAATGKADGTCAPVLAGKDPRGDCKDDGAECKQDGFCDGKEGCEAYASTKCTPNPCAKDEDCTSGACADGVCCDRACDGDCEACTAAKKGAGSDGTCGPVKSGTDPDGDCGTLGTGVCKAVGTCDGKAACVVPTAGKACAAATCSDATTLAAAAKCGSAGDCTPDTIDCAPFLCDAKAVACTTSCAEDTDCAPGATCKSSKCEKSPDGAACKKGIECTSGSCTDGVCCDTPCNGQCEACDVTDNEGTCTAVIGAAPHGARPACDGTEPCAGTCNGIRERCDYPDKTTSCGDETTCDALNGESAQRCNGHGACLMQPTRICDPFRCDGDACATGCGSDDDCIAGASCHGGVCRRASDTECADEHNVALADGGKTSCFPGRCTSGACAYSCTTSDQCGDGADCIQGQCRQGGDSGCGCRVASRPSSRGSAPWVVLAGAVLRRLRRKRGARDHRNAAA